MRFGCRRMARCLEAEREWTSTAIPAASRSAASRSTRPSSMCNKHTCVGLAEPSLHTGRIRNLVTKPFSFSLPSARSLPRRKPGSSRETHFLFAATPLGQRNAADGRHAAPGLGVFATSTQKRACPLLLTASLSACLPWVVLSWHNRVTGHGGSSPRGF